MRPSSKSPSSLTWVLPERTPFPSLPATKALAQPLPPGHPIILRLPILSCPPLSLFHGLPQTWEEVQNPYHSPVCVFQLAFLSPLQPSSFTLSHTGLGSVSPTEAWLPVTKRHLLKEALPVAPLRVAYLLRVLQALLWSLFSGPEAVSPGTAFTHRLPACPSSPRILSLVRSSALGLAQRRAASGSFCPGALSVLECADEAESLGKVDICDTIW